MALAAAPPSAGTAFRDFADLTMNACNITLSSAHGPFPRARMQSRFVELWVFTVLLAVLNWPLFCGGDTGLFAFSPAAVEAGQWWRIVTHPLVHVSWYHFLLDAAAFLILYHGLPVERPWQRLGCVAASAAGSLLMAQWISSDLVGLHGLCGLSGVDHGLMLFSLLETAGSRRMDRRARMLTGLGIVAVLGKVLFEICTGGAFFASVHFGLLGVPVVACHLGGAVAALLFWLCISSAGRETCERPNCLSGICPPFGTPLCSVEDLSREFIVRTGGRRNTSMKIITDSDSQGCVLKLAGEIDLCCVPELRAALEGEAAMHSAMLIVDLSDVSFIDSSGLSALIACWRKMREQGRKLAVVGAQGEVLEVFRLTRLDDLIALYPSKEEARLAPGAVA